MGPGASGWLPDRSMVGALGEIFKSFRASAGGQGHQAYARDGKY